MANGHGGRRPGAGRKPKAARFAPKFDAADERLAGQLDASIGNLFMLADGGFEQVEEEQQPAGLIFVDEIEFDAKGKPTRGKRLAFPDLDPQAMVTVRRKRSIAAPDRVANTYIIDRNLGRPTERHEHTGADGEAMQVVVYIPDNGRDRDPAATGAAGDLPGQPG